MQWFYSLIFLGCVFLATLVLTGVLLRFLRSYDILDYPNHRSSHSIPTPKGAGIVVIGCISLSWIIATWPTPMAENTLVTVLAALVLALLSWFDDIRGLSPLWRFLSQISAVTFVMLLAWSWPKSEFNSYSELWLIILAYIVVGLIWVWFINLFNFMDGVDGISSIETISIGIGIAIIVFITGLEPILGILGLILSASALGFLVWNWQPAKIFLGDVGSIPLGFLLGWLLLQLAVSGQWTSALILPLYYILDTTVILLRRGLSGKKIWQAHNEHFYQQAVLRGFSHAKVVCYIFLVNVFLIILSTTAALGWHWLSLISAVVIVACLLFIFSAKRGSRKS
jgi:UDP-N-acetylmuramyl pentapeptide phosphotransferase/UDP-N-acetylglucosamine-1-phosphate transferase